MIGRMMARFRKAGRRGGVGLFAAIAERARANQRWARSRRADYRVEDFQVHFPDRPVDRIRHHAGPLLIAGAVVVSVGLVAVVAYNITSGHSSAADELVGTIAASPAPQAAAPGPAGAPSPAGDDTPGAGTIVRDTPRPEAGATLNPAAGPADDGAAESLAALPPRTRSDMVILGTGRVTGVYFPAGGAICEMVNMSVAGDDGMCAVTSTLGSVDNLNALRRGDIDVALVQSDWQHFAYEGSVRLDAPGAFDELRALFSIYIEPLTVLARRDSGIRTVADLPGKRIAMGEVGSGSYEAMTVLMSAMGWSSTDFTELVTDPASTYLEALCLGRVDAVALVAGHPNGAAMGITNACDARLVDISGEAIDRLIEDKPYFAMATIPGGFYPGNPDPIRSFGVAATVVASAALSGDRVYALVGAVFDDFDTFRSLHPAFEGLSARDMATRALSAPVHEGARRYYKHRGWQ